MNDGPLLAPGLLFQKLLLMMIVPEPQPLSGLASASEMAGLYSGHTRHTRVNDDGASVQTDLRSSILILTTSAGALISTFVLPTALITLLVAGLKYKTGTLLVSFISCLY